MGDDFTAMNAAQRSQIDDVIGLPDQLKIMLYHNNRVSLINQTLKQLQKIINVDLRTEKCGNRLKFWKTSPKSFLISCSFFLSAYRVGPDSFKVALSLQ